MSRTYRRRGDYGVIEFDPEYGWATIFGKFFHFPRCSVPFDATPEMRHMALELYRRDSNRIKRWSGPGWFHRQKERQFRAKNRVEQRKLLSDPEYCHDIVDKPVLPWWD